MAFLRSMFWQVFFNTSNVSTDVKQEENSEFLNQEKQDFLGQIRNNLVGAQWHYFGVAFVST